MARPVAVAPRKVVAAAEPQHRPNDRLYRLTTLPFKSIVRQQWNAIDDGTRGRRHLRHRRSPTGIWRDAKLGDKAPAVISVAPRSVTRFVTRPGRMPNSSALSRAYEGEEGVLKPHRVTCAKCRVIFEVNGSTTRHRALRWTGMAPPPPACPKCTARNAPTPMMRPVFTIAEFFHLGRITDSNDRVGRRCRATHRHRYRTDRCPYAAPAVHIAAHR